METKNIQKKFSTIYKIVNFLLHWQVAILCLIPILIVAWSFSHGDNFMKNVNFVFSEPLYVFIAIWVTFLAIFTVIFTTYLLFVLRKVAHELKNGQIFTEENAKNIKKLFWCFAIVFIITGLIFSGGIISIIAALFLWVLYEIFFIGFDYKLQNERLEAENNLTI